jgi:chromate transport protein ChrA
MSTGGWGGKGGGELWELARLFTKLGFIAFGGPAAHIAMMRYEVLERSYARSCKRTS